MTKPIRPEDLPGVKPVPDVVIDVFNAHIRKNWKNGSATIRQAALVGDIAARMCCSRGQVFDANYLDVEVAFSERGWDVSYNTPFLRDGENFEPYFIFKPKGAK